MEHREKMGMGSRSAVSDSNALDAAKSGGVASVARHAQRARAEYDACRQYRADAAKVHSSGLLGAKAYASELRRIELLESLLMLGWKSADPAQSFRSVLASALR
ncbi:MAG: hypothetical protein EBT51_11900, partial [Flavobacteriaceae bacterium]|nr:hypothetical protein [Flavobacteriaceae bacterium]